MLQSEQSDILHNCYPLHILLEFDLGILRKYSEYIKKEDKIEPVHEISNNVVCTTSEALDQPAHMCSLIRAFASRLSIL